MSPLRVLGLSALVAALCFTPPPAGAIDYAYDDFGRLVQVVHNDGRTVTYTYDAAGNLLARTVVEDRDRDGAPDPDDNCPDVPNADQSDGDTDGVGNACDNCVEVANSGQEDVDAAEDDDSSLPGIQHYGDACDADLDNDGIVGATDFFGAFRPCLGQDLRSMPACARADLDGDGLVGATDFFGLLRPALGNAPGPGFSEP